MGIENNLSGPVKQSLQSVFDGINSHVESLDLFKRYKKKHLELERGKVSTIKIFGMESPLNILQIYSPTRVSTTIRRRIYQEDWHKINESLHQKRSAVTRKTVLAEEYIEKHDRVVVLAGPGSGKTTFLKVLGFTYGDKKVFQKSKLKKQKTPFFIHLPEVSLDSKSIAEHLYSELELHAGDHAKDYINRQFNTGNAIVLLDSLDEVQLEHKDRVTKKIKQFSNNFSKVKIVLSCRVADYIETFDNFCEVEIARLNKQAINKIIKAWFKDDPKKASALNKHLEHDAEVSSLAETPLLLSLICIQYKHDLNIPERKAELYNRCCEALISKWDTSRGFRRDTAFLSISDGCKLRLFSYVAANFLVKGSSASYIFSHGDLVAAIASFCEELGIDRGDAVNILKEIEAHHGIIEKNSAESWAFSHPSFQEYFAAQYLIDRREEITYLKDNFRNNKSFSVITFVATLLADPSQVLSFLKEKSILSGLKNYPSMARRVELLALLYRCVNSGITVPKEKREDILGHIAKSHMDLINIYNNGGVYPIATLDPDGIKHIYYYSKKRSSLSGSLQTFRKFSNGVLNSPDSHYFEYALKMAKSFDIGKTDDVNKIAASGVILSLVLPLAPVKPEEVNDIIERLILETEGLEFLTSSLERSKIVMEKNFL